MQRYQELSSVSLADLHDGPWVPNKSENEGRAKYGLKSGNSRKWGELSFEQSVISERGKTPRIRGAAGRRIRLGLVVSYVRPLSELPYVGFLRTEHLELSSEPEA